jgi:transposase InsO family protein
MAGEEVPMSLRRLVVEVDPRSMNVAEFCRRHGISTWFFWDLRRRFEVEGEACLEPRRRVARTVANRTPAAVEEAIVAKRKELADAGLDAGPATIAFHLRAMAGLPSESTIWRILRARGFVVPEPAKAPRRAGRSFTAERANGCWQLDDTTWWLADGTEVKILDVVDDHSRLAVASAALTSCTGAAAFEVLAGAAAVLGWPERFLSDNARAFRQALAGAVGVLGVAAGHSRPYHPQTNGKVERFHLTLKRWLRRQPPAATVAELQAGLDAFRHLYNHQRPHRSLGRRFPADVWARAPKSGPADRPLGTATTVGHVTVGANGLVPAGPYAVSVGAAWARRRATVVVTGTACHVFVDAHLVRALTIDPTRRVQPLHGRPGRPARLP